jgi:hypothetical protein
MAEGVCWFKSSPQHRGSLRRNLPQKFAFSLHEVVVLGMERRLHLVGERN